MINRNIKQSLAKSTFNPKGVIQCIPIENIKLLRDSERHQGDIKKLLESIGHDTICTMIAQGYFVIQIATTLSIPNMALSKWLRATPDREDKYLEACRTGAELYAYMSMQILEDADEDKDSMMKAKELSKRYASLAAQMNPKRYGHRPSADMVEDEGRIAIQINIGADKFNSPIDALNNINPVELVTG